MADATTNIEVHANPLTKCDKCDCLYLSDTPTSENGICIYRGRRRNGDRSTSKNRDENVNICNCQSNVKITVHTFGSNSDATASGSDTSTFSRRLHTDFSMKQICLKLCGKNKQHEEEEEEIAYTAEEPAPKSTEPANKSTEPKNTEDRTPQQNMETRGEQTEAKKQCSIEELIKKYCKPPEGAGGHNTNTIIFPSNNCCDTNCSKLEDFIRMEARSTDRKIEEILNELCKQRRDMREVKDILEMLARTVKDVMFMKNGRNTYVDVLEDMCRRNNGLERKSNTLTLSQTANPFTPVQEKEVEIQTVTPLHSLKSTVKVDSKKKSKKSLFLWCR